MPQDTDTRHWTTISSMCSWHLTLFFPFALLFVLFFLQHVVNLPGADFVQLLQDGTT